MCHIINLAIQRGLKDLGVWTTPSDEEENKECTDASQYNNQRIFGETVTIVIMTWASPQKTTVTSKCVELGMPNNRMFVENVTTRWNSIHDMLELAWENSIF